jgi:23S rRNA (adenine2503-C2)-methyltransferase
MTWTTTRRIDSSDENVSKYVFEKQDAVAEAVLYKYPSYAERTVVCCSTQSGCPVGCRFCGAGDSFARNLTADEVVSQTEHLFADRQIDASAVARMQIMFMSMGEPLLNARALCEAIERLHALYPVASLLISTSGPRAGYLEVLDVSMRVPKVGLQFSVHESTDEARNALIPFKAKLTLREIATEGEAWAEATGRRPFFNYCAHGKNSSDADADRILDLFDPEIWEATISVVCERDEHVAAANERQRELAVGFRKKLGDRGFSTRVFDPAGQDDIGGGCGQLWFVQDWMRRNAAMVRPSVGRSLPVVHAPREWQ